MTPELEASFARLSAKQEERKKRVLVEPIAWPPTERESLTGEAHGLRICAVWTPVMAGFPCAYVHVPAGHADCGKWYDDVPAECHGGLTFCCRSMEGGSWFGWDYGHSDDEGAGYTLETAMIDAADVAAWFAARA